MPSSFALRLCLPLVLTTACAASRGSELGAKAGPAATSSASSSSAGGALALDQGGSGGSGGAAPVMIPVRKLPGLVSVTFYETTGDTNAYTFAVNGPELGNKLADPLGKGEDEPNYDIAGALTEYYDVYYSDAQGVADVDGSYLTISGVFDSQSPWGGGLNLAEIKLDYAKNAEEYGNYVASFVALGDNAIPGSVGNCIDGNLATYTTMGNTNGAAGRLRLTLGFLSSSGPPPNPK